MMHNEEVELRIVNVIEELLNLEVPSVECDLFEDAGLDSLLLVDLLVALEETFEIEISLDSIDLEDFRTVPGIVRALVDGSRERKFARG